MSQNTKYTKGFLNKISSKKAVIREWVESIIVAFLLAMVIRTFIVQAFKIPTGSMKPTLKEGDLILVNKFIYGAKVPFTKWRIPSFRQPKRGDVIVFIYPPERKKNFIKRMVGFPGETVEIKNSKIYINNQPLLDYTFSQREYYNRGEFGNEGQKVVIPKDCYFVLGDNSAHSMDSRFWGFVPQDNILGKAILVYWPLTRIRMVK
jgi:signal peptidase I